MKRGMSLAAALRRILSFDRRPWPAGSIAIVLLADTHPQSTSAALSQLPPGATLAVVGTRPPGLSDKQVRFHPSPAAALAVSTEHHVLLVAPGAILAANALARLSAELEAFPGTDLVYADDDRIDLAGNHHDPFHKPAWSLDLALEQDLVGAMLLVRRALLPQQLPEHASLHDLALLVAPTSIRHIAETLAHQSLPRQSSPSPPAVERALAALPGTATLVASVLDPTRHRVQWALPTPEPPISIIIPTRDHPDLLARCVQGLLHGTDYRNLELLIADNDSTLPETASLFAQLRADTRVRILPSPGPFNYSAINNAAAAEASGTILVLLNDDIEVLHPGWLREMAAHALRPEIGAVGARLLFANDTIQHAGVVLGVGCFEGGPGVAGHFGYTAPATDPGPHDQFILTRELSAVTGACLAIRRDVFMQAGGLDATNLPVALNDLDLCLRIRTLGYRILWTPFAELRHLESASRGPDQLPADHPTAQRFRRECRFMRDRWAATLDADPFYNPAFSRFDHSFQPALPNPCDPSVHSLDGAV